MEERGKDNLSMISVRPQVRKRECPLLKHEPLAAVGSNTHILTNYAATSASIPSVMSSTATASTSCLVGRVKTFCSKQDLLIKGSYSSREGRNGCSPVHFYRVEVNGDKLDLTTRGMGESKRQAIIGAFKIMEQRLIELFRNDYIECKEVRDSLKQDNLINFKSNCAVLLNKPKDQGKNCVAVFIKSSRLHSKSFRLKSVTKIQNQVKHVTFNYNIKFRYVSSGGSQVRMDYCFQHSSDANAFFKSVLNLTSLPSSKSVFCSLFLLSEVELGYQHKPELSEQDLLHIQSRHYCRNIFRTDLAIKVVKYGDTVGYSFKSVVDVNKFLSIFAQSNSRSLGLLRMNLVPKLFNTDSKGFFRLFTIDKIISEKFSERHKFKIKPGGVSGNYLLFRNKIDLFSFLVSEDAKDFDHLQFDDKTIKIL